VWLSIEFSGLQKKKKKIDKILRKSLRVRAK
jgi:hypothetical protein